MIKREYDLSDPEQKTEFYHAIAQKLLEFPEELERNNYLDAVCGKYFIPKDSLRQLVNQKGRQVGLTARREPGKRAEERRTGPEKEDGLRTSQRMLLTWLANDGQVYEKVRDWIGPEDFTAMLYQKVAGMLFEQLERGEVAPGRILNHFINDEEEYREVARIFHAELPAELTKEEKEKAFSETVKRVKKNSLDRIGRTVTDMAQLQRVMQEQAALANLHISFD